MRSVVQRVRRARVSVLGEEVGSIETGLLALVGVMESDDGEDVSWMAQKLLSLRVFPDADAKMNLSVADISGSLLVVSQFTLAADMGKGARPSFMRAMAPEMALPLFQALVESLRRQVVVATGRFGAAMEVELLNDGPVTLWLDSRAGRRGEVQK